MSSPTYSHFTSHSPTPPRPGSLSGRSSRTTPESNQILPTINYKFWFDDVHVALVTIDHVAYRVRRDCLETASFHLQRLIADAMKVADKNAPFGCPIVHLDLPSSKLEPFLEVVTDPTGNDKIKWLRKKRVWRSSPNVQGSLSFSWLATVARTADELGAYATMFAALSRIRRFFESDAHLKLVKHSESFQENWALWGRRCGITVDVKHAIEALNLFGLVPTPSRSLLALYACCLLPPAQLRSGVAREDGVVERLSDEDFERCMRALPSLHIASHNNVLKTFAHADHWECIGAHRSAFPCEGKHGIRKIRDAYMAHLKMPGPYRPDLRNLLSSLKHKSLPCEKLFAPEGAAQSLVCEECVKRLVDSSETLCREEAINLEKYFFGEEEETVQGLMSPRCSDDDNNNNAPGELQARSPPSDSEPGSEPEPEPEPEESLRPPGGSGSCMGATPPRRPSSGGPPSIATPRTLPSGLTAPSPRSSPPASDQGDEEAVDEPSSPSCEGSKTSFSPIPRVEIEMPAPLAITAIGWDDHSDDSDCRS